MRGNWVTMSTTAAAANANPTTITAVTNFPTFADLFGSTGSRMVEYELDNGAGKFESGIGTLNLATLSLSRDYPSATYDSGATPKYVSTTVVPLTSFSGTVNVICSPLATSSASAENFHIAGTYGLGNGYCRTQADVTYSTGLQGWRNYQTFLWNGSRPIKSLTINVNAAGTAGTLRVGIMEITGPNSYNLIQEFTTTTQFSLTATGTQTISNFPPLYLPPGPYIIQFLPVSGAGSISLKASINNFSEGAGPFGRASDLRVHNTILDSAGASTLATTFSGTGNGGYSDYQNLPCFVFGMY